MLFALFFALGLSLLPGQVACANVPPKATFATFGPFIGQVSKTGSNETTFQPFSTPSTVESSIRTTTNATTVSPLSAPTVFGTVTGQSSVPGNGQTVATSTTALEACPGPTGIMNSSSTMEATVQIQVSNFVGTVTVVLTQTGSSVLPLGMESGATSIAATTTEVGGLHSNSNLAPEITVIPSQSNSSSSEFTPRSNWTAGYNMTNGSFVNSSSSPRTALTVFTGDGTSHRHINVPGMLPFLVFHVAVVSLL
ncbi:hypothetical protein AG0111_0g12076 [Alternaria gaisen]|uniref:Uncharacterized protein n=1 Tax=Alternaria gaisen TaxID=167740 RepID=A0ACB6F5C4_9PLEO|nr:hypothetical protein AG0111_0g12076 [Alternaria gaisen]